MRTAIWHRLDVHLEMGGVTTVVVADRAICVTRLSKLRVSVY